VLNKLKKHIIRWTKCEPSQVTRQRMRAWFTHLPGRWLQAEERAQLRDILPTLFGYHLLQLGDVYSKACLSSTRIPHCVVLDEWLQDRPPAGERVRSEICGPLEWLPIATDCLDTVVMPHTLEFTNDPHQVLREVDRILIPEGHVVILGFNPWSLWMFWRVALCWQGKPPWCGRFISQARVKDWLQLLGFDIIDARRYFFRPPLSNKSVMRRLRFLDRIGRRWAPFFGAGYVLVARKRVATLTPIKSRWRPARSPIVSPELAGNSRTLGDQQMSEKNKR